MGTKLPRWAFVNLVRGGRVVHFSSRQILDALAGANKAFMDSQAVGAPVESAIVPTHVRSIVPATLARMDGNADGSSPRKHVTNASAARWEKRDLRVLQATAADQWAKLGYHSPEHPLFYQIGPWVVRQGGTREDHYLNVVGSASQRREVGGGWFHASHGHEVLIEDYASLLHHIANNGAVRGRNLGELIRGMLRGEADPAVPASLATLTGAMFVAEVQRRNPTQLINLMWLDLVDQHCVGWSDLTENHSMARGGGKEVGPETFQREATLALHWLEGQSLRGTQFEPSDTPRGDPVQVGDQDHSLVQQLFDIRSSMIGGPAEMQVAADKLGAT
jgi:hypothetical protein